MIIFIGSDGEAASLLYPEERYAHRRKGGGGRISNFLRSNGSAVSEGQKRFAGFLFLSIMRRYQDGIQIRR